MFKIRAKNRTNSRLKAPRIMYGAIWGVFLALLTPQLFAAVDILDEYQTGTWYAADTTYNIYTNILVPVNDTLIIEAGVTVNFRDDYEFTVHGTLLAIGGASDSSKIRFLREIIVPVQDWGGIKFYEGSSGSILSNCEISNTFEAIYCNFSSPQITNNTISARSRGIKCFNGSSPLISNNTINVTGNDVQNRHGILIESFCNPTITENRIEVISNSVGRIYGIVAYSDCAPIIRRNWIEARSLNESYGILTSETSGFEIDHNIIRVNSPNAMVGINCLLTTVLHIYHNDIHLIESASLAVGINVENGSRVKISNNIVIGNGWSTGIHKADNGLVDPESGYNDLWLHQTNYSGLEPFDTDIDADPLFRNLNNDSESWEDYEITWAGYPNNDNTKSPCIDAGNPDMPQDPDDTIPDIGALHFEQEPVEAPPEQKSIAPNDKSLLSAFPNPFNDAINAVIYVNQMQNVTVNIYSLEGKFITTLWDGFLETGNYTCHWNPNDDIPAGIYLIQVSFSDNSTNLLKKAIYLP